MDKAIHCLQGKLSRGVTGLKQAKDAESVEHSQAHHHQQQQQHQPLLPPSRAPMSTSCSQDEQPVLLDVAEPSLLPCDHFDIVGDGHDKNTDIIMMQPFVSSSQPAVSLSSSSSIKLNVAESSQYLAVYPASMVLLRLKKETIRDCAFGLTQLVLFSNANGIIIPASSSASASIAKFWCYCETVEEVSLIVDEESLSEFNESSVIVSPDRWRVIKLCGKTYGFDETGIVAAMSGLNSVHTPVLNISSFGANVTLVLEDALEESVACLCASLHLDRVEKLK